MEILATRAPPQLQECLAVYKHGERMREGAAGAGRGQRDCPILSCNRCGESSGSLSA